MNYLSIHRQSNLVHGVVATSAVPAASRTVRFIPAPDSVLDKYYKLAQKLPGLVPVGDLAAASPYFLEALSEKPTAALNTQRKRKPYERRNAALSA